MNPIFYKWTDASAPVLDGNNGSFLNVLDACLVNGYGSKAAAGWSKPFVGTNIAVYRPGAGPRHYLRVFNAHATLGSINLRGFVSMSDANTGTRGFPTTGQAAGEGAGYTVSATKDAVARPWILIADDRTFYFIVANAIAVPLVPSTWSAIYGFGEFFSAVAGDTNRTYIGTPVGALACWIPGIAPAGLNSREALGIGSWASSISGAFSNVPWPNPIDSAFYIDYIGLGEATASTGVYSTYRGRHRGFYSTPHAASNFSEGDTFDGTGDFAGKSFYINTTFGIFETTPWEINS